MPEKRAESIEEVVASMRNWASHVGDEDDTWFEWTVKEMRECILDFADRVERAAKLEISEAVLDGLTKIIMAVESVRDEQWDKVHSIHMERIAERASNGM